MTAFKEKVKSKLSVIFNENIANKVMAHSFGSFLGGLTGAWVAAVGSIAVFGAAAVSGPAGLAILAGGATIGAVAGNKALKRSNS